MGLLPKNEKVSYRLAKTVLAGIKRDELKPGDRLPAEAEMMESFGVSRSSVREALRILELQGLISIKPGPNGGPVLGQPDSGDFGRAAALHFNVADVTFHDLVESRYIMEPELVRRAAKTIDREGQAALRASLQRAWDAQHGPAPQWEHASADFHILVARLGNNKLLALVNDALATILDERIRLVVPVADRQLGNEAHVRIADAIIAGDGDRAAHLMRAHLEALTARIVELQPKLLEEVIEWH